MSSRIFKKMIVPLSRRCRAWTCAGISDQDRTRLSEPYFSTKNHGMGPGLAIVSSVAGDHSGKINVQDNCPRGARFVVKLPEQQF